MDAASSLWPDIDPGIAHQYCRRAKVAVTTLQEREDIEATLVTPPASFVSRRDDERKGLELGQFSPYPLQPLLLVVLEKRVVSGSN